MKVKILKPTVVDVKYLKVTIEDVDFCDWELNYNELESIESHPFHTSGDNIEFVIELETGKVLGWCEGNRLETFDKVRDQGIYSLMDSDFYSVYTYEGYVPKMLDTRGDGYGDYLQFVINEKGYIENWRVYLNDFDCEWVS